MKTLTNLYGLEGKFLTIGADYEIFDGVSGLFVLDDEGDLVEVTLHNFV